MCGRISAEKKGKSKDMSPGELKELQRKKVNRDSSREDKQRFWDEQCLGWAIGTGRKVGAAAYRYKNEFGVFPPHFIQNVPRSSQWKMHARDFYRDIIVPEKKKLEQELRDEFEQ
jgi:hypothetical protein